MQLIRNFLYFLFLAMPATALAQHYYTPPQGIGGVANNMMGPVSLFANFIGSGAISIGICFLFAAIIKYRRHRHNPLEVPISTVVILVIMGVLLLCIPLAYKLTESGFPLAF